MVDPVGRPFAVRAAGAGPDVYVLDWGYPDRSERFQTLEDYRCAHRRSGMLRVRSGGPVDLLARAAVRTCYAALRQQKLGKLITMVTPVDFQTETTCSRTGRGRWTWTCWSIRWATSRPT